MVAAQLDTFGVTLADLLEESDGESVYCGPPSDDEILVDVSQNSEVTQPWSSIGHPPVLSLSLAENVPVDVSTEAQNNHNPELEETENVPQNGALPAGSIWPTLVRPKGDVKSGQKFICVFQVGLEEDSDFCLVKRILGKQGNNMRGIAEACNVKVRLRGRGSGFLEGSHGKETNMPLNLNVSCSDFESYSSAVERLAILLNDIYRHYRRYRRSLGADVPDLKVHVDEMRRDDLDLNMLVKPVKYGNVPAPSAASCRAVMEILDNLAENKAHHASQEKNDHDSKSHQAQNKIEKVEAEKPKVTNTKESPDDSKIRTEKVWVFDRECGRIIGRGGDNLRDIMNKTQTEIKISQRKDDSPERCVEICGPAAGRQIALQMILSEVTYCRHDINGVIKSKK